MQMLFHPETGVPEIAGCKKDVDLLLKEGYLLKQLNLVSPIEPVESVSPVNSIAPEKLNKIRKG